MEGGGGRGYSSKTAYLISSVQAIVLLAAASAVPFLAGRRRSGLFALTGILLVGSIAIRLEGAPFR